MRIVLDTNALLRCLSTKSSYAFVLDFLIESKFDLFLTKDILLEYEEKSIELFSSNTAELLIGILNTSSSVYFVEVYYNLNLIEKDPDDNKFVDCAFASNAHYIVTNDKHFNLLQSVEFPKINTITLEGFAEILREQKL